AAPCPSARGHGGRGRAPRHLRARRAVPRSSPASSARRRRGGGSPPPSPCRWSTRSLQRQSPEVTEVAARQAQGTCGAMVGAGHARRDPDLVEDAALAEAETVEEGELARSRALVHTEHNGEPLAEEEREPFEQRRRCTRVRA